ncbi:MAG: class I SAM-dependent methyltransferase [Humidesulfovibrio sp.]|uniref:class I SAM-dependent methyltransferase n=1 Tax=Humidesulfovibrio sp. TaxID=2910988 RepID=UPI0027ED6437|nr:class I SAM-dependent methyltransferase [Humidesulfovibrio sp.]MDQ7834259.1 class I SAM-dependent methyltransferase [Humidesulfovibrio sp.]
MQEQNHHNISDHDTAVAFYQDRYAQGYMDAWPTEKKDRVFEIVRELDLPATGEALDFGCGNGIFTDIIRQALPTGWKVYGTDISNVAISNAKLRYPECTFFASDDIKSTNKKFDYLFTHHTLEHVYNIDAAINDICNLMNVSSSMLHILPCGNKGSLEHAICSLRVLGIDNGSGGRFFFEDKGHLRRLTTDALRNKLSIHGFHLSKQYYSNQHYGSISWIVHSLKTILDITDYHMAVSKLALLKLIFLRVRLISYWFSNTVVASVESTTYNRCINLRCSASFLVKSLLYVFAKPISKYLLNRIQKEWNTRKTDNRGSEMYLYFKRPNSYSSNNEHRND